MFKFSVEQNIMYKYLLHNNHYTNSTYDWVFQNKKKPSS